MQHHVPVVFENNTTRGKILSCTLLNQHSGCKNLLVLCIFGQGKSIWIGGKIREISGNFIPQNLWPPWVRIYGRDTNFRYMLTVTLRLEIWPWVKFMIHILVMDNNCVNISIQLGIVELWPGHRFSVCVHCDLDIKKYDIVSRSWHSWVMDNKYLKYYQDQIR